MSAKEQAKKLINKFYQPLGYLKINESSNKLWEYGKRAAIICVDMLLYDNNANDQQKYWQEVKNEILKM